MTDSMTAHLVAPVAGEEDARVTAASAHAHGGDAEIVAATDGASLTLVNVQLPAEEEDAASPVEQGEALIEQLIERTELTETTYETRVVVEEDTEAAILETATEYDTVCVGAMRESALTQALFGSLPWHLGTELDRTVVVARGSERSPMSIRDAFIKRLEGKPACTSSSSAQATSVHH
ncbi:universal stress protein [Halorhabdus rudnickae]|uniref:universal stress protein n=1 Tax=Halorhabdus rudnickae TaxID=1775544 RepID=UPI0010828CE3|nr:universal stress protein [Halorhabdus rudnickae]